MTVAGSPELSGKSRTEGTSLGVDALDIVFRLEKSFGVNIPRGRVFEEASLPTFGFPVKLPGAAEVDVPPPEKHSGYPF